MPPHTVDIAKAFFLSFYRRNMPPQIVHHTLCLPAYLKCIVEQFTLHRSSRIICTSFSAKKTLELLRLSSLILVSEHKAN